MTHTSPLLANRTVRELGTVAHSYGLPFNNRKPKTEIYARVVAALGEGQHLQRAYRTLSSDERDALRTLHTAGGELAQTQFSAYFGEIRPYRPWVAESPRQPWKRPISAAEKVWYLGFIELRDDQVVLCADIGALLPPLPMVHPAPTMLDESESTPAALLVDLAAFLGSLMHDRAKVMHGRWLSPRSFRRIDRALRVRESEIMAARSERGVGRLRYLHYLADCAGLVNIVNGALKPSIEAWAWLDSAPDVQWRMLNEAVARDLSARNPLWERYGLPAISRAAWDRLHQVLETLPSGATYGVRALLKRLHVECPGVSAEQIRALLSGPLSWSGQVMLCADGKQFVYLNNVPPMFPIQTPATLVESESALIIHLSEMPPLRPLVEILGWATADGEGLAALRIGGEAVRRALGHDLSVSQIAEQIGRLTGAPLSRAQFERFERWSREGGQFRVEHLTVLSSPESALLNELLADRGVRNLLEKPLSPHHIVVRAGAETVLARRLARRGQLATPESESAKESIDAPISVAAYAWLAMRVYQELGGLLPQLIPIPGAISDEIKSLLTDTQRDQLEQAAQNLAEKLRRALRGDSDPFAAAPMQDDLPAIIQAAIERAVADRGALTIEYFSPTYGAPTLRTIEPLLPIRWHGEIGYVEAWCRLDDAPRTFRLDRILRVLDESKEGEERSP